MTPVHTKPPRQASPCISNVVNTPEPAGITAPEKEKPITVPFPVETVKPASAAAPPEALITPGASNWNPATSTSLLYTTSTVTGGGIQPVKAQALALIE